MRFLQVVDSLCKIRYFNNEQFNIFNKKSRSNGSFFLKCAKLQLAKSFAHFNGVCVEYNSLESVPYYADCKPLVEALGYQLVELRVFRTNGTIQIKAVVANKIDSQEQGIGINDCAKVHRVLLPRLEALLQSDDTYMEVTSPGTERHIKNAAEFAFFVGKYVKVYDTSASDWVQGKIASSTNTNLVLDIDGKEQIVSYDIIAKAKLLNI